MLRRSKALACCKHVYAPSWRSATVVLQGGGVGEGKWDARADGWVCCCARCARFLCAESSPKELMLPCISLCSLVFPGPCKSLPVSALVLSW